MSERTVVRGEVQLEYLIQAGKSLKPRVRKTAAHLFLLPCPEQKTFQKLVLQVREHFPCPVPCPVRKSRTLLQPATYGWHAAERSDFCQTAWVVALTRSMITSRFCRSSKTLPLGRLKFKHTHSPGQGLPQARPGRAPFHLFSRILLIVAGLDHS